VTIKGGQLVTIGREVIVRRIQSTNPALNLPTETIRELGNGNNVAIIRDTPDISYDVESLDTSTDFEALLTRVDPAATDDGDEFNLAEALPLDVISAFKGKGSTAMVRGVALPYLYLESAAYRFAVGQNASQRFTLRGDSVFYSPGTVFHQTEAAAGLGPYLFDAGPAIKFTGEATDIYALCLTVFHADGTCDRLNIVDDFTNTTNGFTLVNAPAVGDVFEVVYASNDARSLAAADDSTLDERAAAVRGAYIDVYVSDGAATPTLVKWRGLQAAEINWRVNAEVTNELGNTRSVERDWDQADLNGTLTMRPSTVQYLFDRVAQVADVPADEVVGALSSQPLEMRIVVNHPDTRVPVKTFIVEDARIQPVAIPGQVNQRTEVTWTWGSDTGALSIVKGAAA
jgi:hypothetical protein